MVSEAEAEAKAKAEALGLYDQQSAAEDAYARVMVLGHAKSGKTTCLSLTAPKPMIINCDGLGATKGAASEGAQFLGADVTSVATWGQAIIKARKAVDAGLVQTIILDTATLLADTLLDELVQKFEGYDLWRELEKLLVGGVKQLNKLDAHVFVTAHVDPGTQDNAAGQMPSIGGKSKFKLPAIMHDWILLDVDPSRKPERVWLLGPQKQWNHSGRNIRRSVRVEATVPALFEELGIKL